VVGMNQQKTFGQPFLGHPRNAPLTLAKPSTIQVCYTTQKKTSLEYFQQF